MKAESASAPVPLGTSSKLSSIIFFTSSNATFFNPQGRRLLIRVNSLESSEVCFLEVENVILTDVIDYYKQELNKVNYEKSILTAQVINLKRLINKLKEELNKAKEADHVGDSE